MNKNRKEHLHPCRKYCKIHTASIPPRKALSNSPIEEAQKPKKDFVFVGGKSKKLATEDTLLYESTHQEERIVCHRSTS
jgi:hypothetical protein